MFVATEKKKKNLEAFIEQRCHFTPFIVSCEGLMAKEADNFLFRIMKKTFRKLD